MNKQDILKEIKKITKKNGVDLTYDEQVERLFYELEQKLDLNFSVYLRSSVNDGWLQCEYHSKKLGKTIIWNYEVGNFDDFEEMADFIINTTKEIKVFERKLTKI